jgi:quercetin dioxygenase-like cupin family protein
MHEPWASRRFSFDYPVERFPVFLDRLRGTIARIEALAGGVAPERLTTRREGTWSIQEHVGHLHDLEALHLRRLDEIERGAATLSAADMDNRATWNARHNDRPFAEVFAGFCGQRATLLQRLRAFAPDRLGQSAMHPRLEQPMRVVDVAFFTAEHDDFHLARMRGLLEQAGPTGPAPAHAARWTDLPRDEPMALLHRHRLIGSEAMLSHVTLQAGCTVPVHAHANEQFSCVLSGRVRFVLADGDKTLAAGEVLHLPRHAPHGAEALENSVVLDVFAPPSATTGIDR